MIFGKSTEKKLVQKMEGAEMPRSHRIMLWERFRKNRMALWSLRILYGLVFLTIFGPFLANEKPLVCKIDGRISFPILQAKKLQTIPWKEKEYDWVLFPPIPYSANTLNLDSKNFASPFGEKKSDQARHWLGTHNLGKDVLAGMIEGTRVAMLVGLIAMSIAAFIGISLGALAGYFGDNGIRLSRGKVYMNLLALFFAFFYGFVVRSYALTEGNGGIELLKSIGIVVFIFLVFNVLAILFKPISFLKEEIPIPLDLLVMRLIEIVNAMPGLLLLLAAIAIIKEPNVFYVMAIIGLISWTSIARFIRAELLRIRRLPYIEAARALGFSEFSILLKHAIPNALGPVLITIAFGIAGAILVESTLSFLSIGTGEEMTWGRMLSHARVREEAWWLAIFPGLAIFVTVTIFNLIGEGLSEAFEAKSNTK